MTCIVAEVGSNFRDFLDLIGSVRAAERAGADVVKFQWFSEKDLYGYGDDSKNITKEQLEKLKEAADKYNLEFMVTVFNERDVRQVNKLVKRYKVASSEMAHVKLLAAIKKTGKPVLLSTGGHDYNAIKSSMNQLGEEYPVTLMYCCNAYPSTLHDLNLIHEMVDRFKVDVGYSDHSIDVFTPYVAAKFYGVPILEKHFTLSHDISSPDKDHSLDKDDFRIMCDMIRGEPFLRKPNPQEKPAVLIHNRRIIATKNLNSGDALQYGVNFGIYRSKQEDDRAVSPHAWSVVDGSRATRGIKQGDPICTGDFK